ncbi:aminotransferase class I/II-fold pyridoxal phosphate-dependent enzyme [Lacticigenium naphthae]|uniref:methionine gamma-lyase family protein n=1 Tax=Lacticigenium naphthae TaxID=515351 RepID=UPI0004257167|nr:methionine gamma-lyase family protein [Lacticigenium naphthae]
MSSEQMFGAELAETIRETEKQIEQKKTQIHEQVLYHQNNVLKSFRKHKVSQAHLLGTTGYGYDDLGRDTLDRIYADVFGAESAIVRSQIISGTHAIATALFGVLRPGDDLLYITGEPYDTLQEVVGLSGNGIGSFKEYQIGFDSIPLTSTGKVDYKEVRNKLTAETKVVAIQRSRGYASRPSFTIKEIEEMIQKVREISPDCIVFVDNCYGEFVEEKEPTQIGADLIAGSLIKNPGGGLAKTGGYIAGRKNLVEKCAYRLTSPGIGREAGASIDVLADMYQGFFLAPHVVGEALKGAIYTAGLLERLGVKTEPNWDGFRTDLIQSVDLKTKEQMVKFIQTIQKYSPIDAHVLPIGGYMPGYEDDIIMAAGTFVQGASIELSADGPIRPPFTIYLQGGLTYEHVKLAVSFAVKELYF